MELTVAVGNLKEEAGIGKLFLTTHCAQAAEQEVWRCLPGVRLE